MSNVNVRVAFQLFQIIVDQFPCDVNLARSNHLHPQRRIRHDLNDGNVELPFGPTSPVTIELPQDHLSLGIVLADGVGTCTCIVAGVEPFRDCLVISDLSHLRAEYEGPIAS